MKNQKNPLKSKEFSQVTGRKAYMCIDCVVFEYIGEKKKRGKSKDLTC